MGYQKGGFSFAADDLADVVTDIEPRLVVESGKRLI